MAYKEQDDAGLIEDLHSRKEFAQLWMPPGGALEEGVDRAMLQAHQQFIRNFVNPNSRILRVHLMHSTGCHTPGTPILMRGGTMRAVENLAVGDEIAGVSNGESARIIETHRGVDEMFELVPSGDGVPAGAIKYIVNAGHILHILTRAGWADVSVACLIAQFGANVSFYMGYATAGVGIRTVSFGVRAIGRGIFYGFTLDCSDGLYRGVDGLILHNSGKTRAAIGAAQEFVKMFRFIYRGVNWRDPGVIGPSVFVIAFGGKQSFVRDLIKYPEYGYASSAEYETFSRLLRESVESDEAYRKFSDYYSMLKRRTTNRARGGFYKMFGYEEFANRLFTAGSRDLNDIIAEAHRLREPCYAVLERAITRGEITPNAQLLARLENSVIIADEIHNTYNSQSINNRGLALQYALDHVQGLRFISLSATPINSVPAEIADFINYFVPPERKITRESLFSGNVPLPGAIARINELLRGRVSFLYDFDPHYFPRRLDVGVSIGDLPYLRFTPCEMSQFFINTLRAYEATRASDASVTPAPGTDGVADLEVEADYDEEVIGITQSAYSLFDMVFPNPASDTVGLYNSGNTFATLHSAQEQWKREHGVSTKIAGNMRIIGGAFLRVPKLREYSAKYASLVDEVLRVVREGGPTKILIYHERVRATGVILVREILRENGMIGSDDEPADDTICAICARERRTHGDGSVAHEFRPLRFVALYSELDKTSLTSIRERYNSPANLHGEWCSILIGSKLIRESYDFHAVRHLFVLSLPVSIAQLIQVFGRVVRRGSHTRLPEAERDVRVHVLVNAAGVNLDAGGSHATVADLANSPEVRRYALKLSTYLVVQQIEREMARGAVDAGLNADIITKPDRDSLGMLLFDAPIKFTLPDAAHPMRVDTFFAYGYGHQEIISAVDIIKKLFRTRGIWPAIELAEAVRSPTFRTLTNPTFITDASILIALAYLSSHSESGACVVGTCDRAVIIDGTSYLIIAASRASDAKRGGARDEGIIARTFARDDYFFLAPVESVEVAGITRARPLIDIESTLRGPHYESESIIATDQYELQSSFDESIAPILRAKYASKTERPNVRALVGMRAFLIQFSSDHQRIIARHFVENAKMRAEFPALYAFMNALGIFVSYDFASRYRDVARRMKYPTTTPQMPVGYGDGAAIRLYTGDEWVTLNRSALNMHVEFEENEVIVGIYRQFPYEMKFQLRDPIQKLRAKTTTSSGRKTDARLIERGSVCATRSRAVAIRDAQRLGIRMADIREADTTIAICDLIQDAMLTREIEARRAGHRSQLKFVYGWWNVVPVP
jgi:hypothetical protein